MTDMGAREVELAVAEMLLALGPYESRDWREPAGSLDWSCWETAVHVAHDLLAYAGQIAAGQNTAGLDSAGHGTGYLPFDLTARAGTAPRDVLRVVAACGRLLGDAISTAGPDTRGWHWGPTDPSGFAALGVNEILLHTYDIAQGLSAPWLPPEPLCAAVLDRLFPDAPAGDPVRVLLWSTGRAELDDRPRLTSWVLKAARG